MVVILIYSIISQNINNSDICEKDIELEISGVIQDYKVKPESRGTPYFKIENKWYNLSSFGRDSNLKESVGDSIIKINGQSFITIYKKIATKQKKSILQFVNRYQCLFSFEIYH
ncbi:hypothetical protein [Marivirga sp.]|uniref:hypothetical protein n=1 Tax=Marivirga sp. TaxID=2018662 RepID=UPI002D7E2DBD|nr:hypothetical protein [Marivirga sp.]HET8858975.1 hypothetical protein [Marivirga sp.]